MRPPALARWLWERLAPERIAEDALDDLEEEYRLYKYPELGRFRARAWFWYQVVGALIAIHTKYSRPRGREGGWVEMGTLLHSFRHAVRTLRNGPAFTAFAVATLAIGIGATSAIFSVVNAVLLTPLPYDDPEELVVIGGTAGGSGSLRVSGAEYTDFLESASIRSLGAAYLIDANLTGGERPERVAVALVTHDFFEMLRTGPALGRDFEPEDAGVDIGYVLLLSHGAWQRMYGGDPAAVGATVELDEDPFTVIGVMPEGFRHPGSAGESAIDAWVPFDPTSVLFGNRRARWLDAFGRLAEGADLSESRAEFAALSQGFRELYPDVYPEDSQWRLTVVPLRSGSSETCGRRSSFCWGVSSSCSLSRARTWRTSF